MDHVTVQGTDKDIKAALLDVNLPNLLLSMYCITGDRTWIAEDQAPAPVLAPEGSLFPDDTGGYSDAQAQAIRASAAAVLMALRDGERTPGPVPDSEQFRELLEYGMGEEVTSGYANMLLEETGLIDRDQNWLPVMGCSDAARRANFEVLIIGAGMSGLGMAAKLKRAGISFTIIERNDQVGGTWYENRYPDCGVDTPNHFYSYSFHRNPDWSGYFSKRDELFAYFDRCADEFGVRDQILFETEVTRLQYDEINQSWQVHLKRGDGESEVRTANAVVSAVGQLNQPSMPDIPGLEDFEGDQWHSARWRAKDLAGLKVGVIGTGCSCVQLLPKTADQAEHTRVYQRTPHWVAPSRDYYRAVEPGLIWALKHIPFYAEFHRARMILVFADRSWPAVVGDPAWEDQSLSMNEANHGMREALTAFMRESLGPKQDYLEHCVPKFPVWGKRLIVDNGWYETLAREDVSLETDGIECVTATGIQTSTGEHHELDVIIHATGFKANHFLMPMEVIGRGGQTLVSAWGNAPSAYKGSHMPGFPNLFCLYGPNTNIVHGGSIIYQIECQIHYVMQCLALMFEKSLDALDVRAEANANYNEDVQARSANLAWGHPNVQSWYKNSDGQVINNSPFSLQEFWEVTHDITPEDFELLHAGSNAATD